MPDWILRTCDDPRSVSICSKNNFERAETDVFVVETSELGKILKLQIGHDDS